MAIRQKPPTTGETGGRLWLPQYVLESQYNRERYSRFKAGFVQVFRTQPETPLPDDPQWVADPLGSKTWRLYYHGLTWLLAPAWGAHFGRRRQRMNAQDAISSILASYFDANVFNTPADEMAWDDHAAADRLATLCWLADRLPESLHQVGADQIEAAVHSHITALEGFFRSQRWLESNHGLFHALALLDVPVAFPDHPDASHAGQLGREYFSIVTHNIVDADEGVTVEQSVHYHQFLLRLFRSALPFLDSHYPELGPPVCRLLGGMVAFNRLLAGWDNSMPALGDSRAFDQIPDDCLSVEDTHPDDIEASVDVDDFLAVFPRSGYVIFRYGEPDDASVGRATLSAHRQRAAHGHFDALSVTLQLAATDVLVDSGGPYAYGDYMRFGYFVASRAHNVILIDDEDHEGSGSLDGYGAHGRLRWVAASHDGYPGRIVVRTVVWDPGEALIVFDQVSEGAEAQFDALWHYPPGAQATVNAGPEGGIASTLDIDGSVVHMKALATAKLSSTVVEGVEGEKPQGWITRRLGHIEPAPVQIVTARSHHLDLVTAFGRRSDIRLYRRGESVIADIGGTEIHVDEEGIPRFSTGA